MNVYVTGSAISKGKVITSDYLPPVWPSTQYCNCSSTPEMPPSAQSRVIQSMNPHILICMSLGANLASLFTIKPKFPFFVDYMEAIDAKLCLLMVHQNRSYRTSYWLLAFLFPVLFLFSFPLLISYVYLSEHENVIHFFWYTSIVIHNLVSYSSELQLVTLFLLLKLKFRVINCTLQRISRGSTRRSPFFRPRKIQNLTATKKLEDEVLLKYIEITHNCFLKLWDSWTLLNQMYAIQVLFSTCGCFLKALFNVYLMLMGGTADAEGRLDGPVVINYILWMTFYFARFVIMAIVASSATNEANRTKSIIAFVTISQDEPAVKEELDLFFLNAKCRHLEFSVCGLYILNSELIMKACGTGITYLVLLVQFKPQMQFS
ncbi:Gustatory Receptor [Nesidiocoris tenuis]|nr:Gustatory Receptor [Nesidiocoris tenuis]